MNDDLIRIAQRGRLQDLEGRLHVAHVREQRAQRELEQAQAMLTKEQAARQALESDLEDARRAAVQGGPQGED